MDKMNFALINATTIAINTKWKTGSKKITLMLAGGKTDKMASIDQFMINLYGRIDWHVENNYYI